jgi:hypothetical protein
LKKQPRTYVENLLAEHRKKPTKTIRDRKQIDLLDLILERKSLAAEFARLDEVIRRKLAEDGDGHEQP